MRWAAARGDVFYPVISVSWILPQEESRMSMCGEADVCSTSGGLCRAWRCTVHIFQEASRLQDSLQPLATVSFTLRHDASSILVSTWWVLEPSQFYQNRIPLASKRCPRTPHQPQQHFLRTAPCGLSQRSDSIGV